MTLKVIVADDDADTANMLATLIKLRTGGEAFAVQDGHAAVSLAREHKPDVVVLDLNMPVLDGAAAAVAIRQSATGPLPVLICISGNLESVSSLKGTSVFDHVFTKPVDLPAFFEVLKSSRSG